MAVIYVTVLDQNLGSCEATMHGSHMQRALPFFILLNSKNGNSIFTYKNTIKIIQICILANDYNLATHILINLFFSERVTHLHADVSTIVDEQLKTQHPAGGRGSQMQRRAAV